MNEAAAQEIVAEPDAVSVGAPAVVVAARAEPQLAALAEARGITLRFLRRLDDVAARMTPEEQASALAEKGQMVMNLVRADRALRQIVVLEQEIMGLRAPATPRGGGTRGAARDDAANDDRDEGPSEQDLSDLNDIKEFDDLYDLDDPDDREEYEDLKSLEKYGDFETYENRRKRDWDRHAREAEARDDIDDSVMEELQTLAEQAPEQTDEEHRAAIQKLDALLKAEFQPIQDAMMARWEARRAALLRRNDALKRLTRRGRWPPKG